MKSVSTKVFDDLSVATFVVENTAVVSADQLNKKQADGTNYAAQTSASVNEEPNFELVGFFAIGVAINVLMVTAFFVWAVKQWKKN